MQKSAISIEFSRYSSVFRFYRSELFTSGGEADESQEQYGSHQPTESYDDERSLEYPGEAAVGVEMQEAESDSEQAEQQSESGESVEVPSDEQEMASEQGSREENASEDPESRSSQENEGGDAESEDDDDDDEDAENGNTEAVDRHAANDVELAEPVAAAAAAAATGIAVAEPMEADEAEQDEEEPSNEINAEERDENEDEEMADESDKQPEAATATAAADTKADTNAGEEQPCEANGENDAEAKPPATADDETKDDASVSASDTKSESRKRRRSRSKSRSKSPPAKRAARRTSPARNTDDFTNEEDEPEYDDSAILLSWYDSDLHLSINKPDLCSARPISDGALGLAWAGARATYGVNSGKVCYEVQVNEINRVQNLSDERNLYELRCGWSTLSDSLQLGETPLSYGYSGCAKKAADNVFSEYGIKYGSRGDVVGVYLDLDSAPCTIQYTVNGEAQGVAFEFEKADLNGQALFPHVISKNLAFTVNFGQSPKLLVNEERPNRTRRDDKRANNKPRSDKADAPKDGAEKPKPKDGDEKSKDSGDEAEMKDADEKVDETEAAEKADDTKEASESAEPKAAAVADESADNSKEAEIASNNGDEKEADAKESDEKEADEKEADEKGADGKEADEKEAVEKMAVEEVADEKEANDKEANDKEASDKETSDKETSDKEVSEKDAGSDKEAGSDKDADSDKDKPAELQHTLLPDYVLIGNVPKDELVRGYERPKTRNECEVILLIGLPGAGKTHWANQHSKENVDKHYNILGVQNLLNKMTVSADASFSSANASASIVRAN